MLLFTLILALQAKIIDNIYESIALLGKAYPNNRNIFPLQYGVPMYDDKGNIYYESFIEDSTNEADLYIKYSEIVSTNTLDSDKVDFLKESLQFVKKLYNYNEGAKYAYDKLHKKVGLDPMVTTNPTSTTSIPVPTVVIIEWKRSLENNDVSDEIFEKYSSTSYNSTEIDEMINEQITFLLSISESLTLSELLELGLYKLKNNNPVTVVTSTTSIPVPTDVIEWKRSLEKRNTGFLTTDDILSLDVNDLNEKYVNVFTKKTTFGDIFTKAVFCKRIAVFMEKSPKLIKFAITGLAFAVQVVGAATGQRIPDAKDVLLSVADMFNGKYNGGELPSLAAGKTLDAITLIKFFSLGHKSTPIIKSVFEGIKPGRYDSINKVIQEYFRTSNVGDFPVNFKSLFKDLSNSPEKDFIEHSMNYVRNNPDKVYTNLNQILETISISRYISQSDNRPGAIDIQNFYDEIKSKVSDELIADNIDKKYYKTSIDNIRDRVEAIISKIDENDKNTLFSTDDIDVIDLLKSEQFLKLAKAKQKNKEIKYELRALITDLSKCYTRTGNGNVYPEDVKIIIDNIIEPSEIIKSKTVGSKNTVKFLGKNIKVDNRIKPKLGKIKKF